MEIISIKNEFLCVEINTFGAEIKSVKSNNGTEFIWEADPNVWGSSAPVLFPICGALKDGQYKLYGQSYDLRGHGFANCMDFNVRSVSDKKAVLFIKETEETLKEYPFEFVFEVVFELESNTLKVTYNVTNNSSKTLYYSVGCHEAYACPEGIDEYEVQFEKECDFDNWVAKGPLVTGETVSIMKNTNVLPLKEEYYETIDTLIFKDLGVYSAVLKHKNSSKKITIDFPKYDALLFWQKKGAKYICIEPWKGFPDHVDTDGDFTKKDGIQSVCPNKTSSSVHTIKFEE